MPTEPIKNEIVVGVVQEDPTLYILGRYVSPITIKTLDGKYETVARVVSVQDACA